MATVPANPFALARSLANHGQANSDPAKSPVFSFSAIARPMTVVVSSEVLEIAGAAGRMDLLMGLLQQQSIRMYRYADDGPPIENAKLDGWGVPVAPDWITFVEADESLGAHAVGGAHLTLDGKQTSALVGGRDLLNLATTSGQTLYPDQDSDYLERRAKADVTAALVASAANADLFITTRPLCVGQRGIRPGGVLTLLPDDAIPIVSLYLRCGGIFLLDGVTRTNRGPFWWVGARELLPAGWDWMTACVYQSVGTDDESLSLLAGSAHTRVARALQARDAIHAALLVPQDNDTGDIQAEQFEVLLVSLMGALDAAARVAHFAIGLPSSTAWQAKWQGKDWVKELGSEAPNLWAAVMSPDAITCLEIVRRLRNSVHGEALRATAVSRSIWKRDDTLIALPRGDADALRVIMEASGGEESWGVRPPLMPGRLYVDLAVLVERLMPGVLQTLNTIFKETPLARFDRVEWSSIERGAPSDNVWHPDIRRNVRWQLGLPETASRPEQPRLAAARAINPIVGPFGARRTARPMRC